MNETLLVLAVLFFLVESLIEMVQKVIEEFDWRILIAFALGGGGAFFFGFDLLGYLGAAPAIDMPGVVEAVNSFFVGVLVARYSGELNALLEILQGFKVDAQRKINGG